MIEVAKRYREAGFSCLPTNKDKTPAISAWKGIDIAPGLFTAYGIAIKCGEASGGLECVDFDNHFGDARDVISDFMKVEGVKVIYEKHRLPVETSVNGGFHLLYRCPVIEGNKKLAMRPRSDERTGKARPDVLIETRGEGGYFVAAPTPGYTVIKNDILSIPVITPEERGILLSAAMTFNTWVERTAHPEEDRSRPGNIFNDDPASVEEMRSALLLAGWTDVGGGKWRRPGKTEGISATLGIAADRIFYNFSQSAHPFEPEKGYTAFQVVGLLNYDGDFKSFASHLAERYKTALRTENVTGSAPKRDQTDDELDALLTRSMINFDIPVPKPPVILKIKAQIGTATGYSRVLTLGNFSAITGKSKSKKTFLTTMLITAALDGGYYDKVFYADLPAGRRGVLLFDTEQSNYDAFIAAKRVPDLLGRNVDEFGAFDLREFSPLERCKLIDRALEKLRNSVSYVVIDGIADLAMAINDEVEASRVVSLLMKWTKIYNIHITLVIHQNKNDDFATGHLGSAIMKKTECIMTVSKDQTNASRSLVECNLIRGARDFDKFSFTINEHGLPVVDEEGSYFLERARF